MNETKPKLVVILGPTATGKTRLATRLAYDFNGEIIGKHYNRENAIKALTKLNNTSHSVITAYTIIDTKTGKTVSKAITSTVTFKNNSPEDIEKYVDLDKPFDKAGYAIEDPHFNLAAEIIGDEDAIIGLPVKDLALDLKQFGINSSKD